jgi:hypothetical protein
MLHVTGNTGDLDIILIREGLDVLRRRLPKGWSVHELSDGLRDGTSGGNIDALAELRAPDRGKVQIVVEAKRRLEPKSVSRLVEAAHELQPRSVYLVIARHLSESTRARLQEGNLSYLDLTGNARIIVTKPGLFIETDGEALDPDREARGARSLRGAKAGRIVRALVDHKEPLGVRELAGLTAVDAGYVSRVLSLLDTEALIKRVGHGKTQSVDWPALLRRWAQEAPVDARGTERTYLDPRGLVAFGDRLKRSGEHYAVTGGLAAAAYAPIAAPRLGMVWIRDSVKAAERLGVRPADAGANVLLIEPGDKGVFEGAAVRNDNIWYAAPSQVAADLLTSPGRGPAEGEELIGWMQSNEKKWRR